MSNFPKVLVSRREQIRYIGRFLSLSAFVLGGALAPVSSVDAQLVVAGKGSASMQMQARVVVGYRLHARAIGAPRVVGREGGFAVVELDVEAASNAEWRLMFAAPAANGQPIDMQVRDARGQWVALSELGRPVSVLEQQEPCNPRPIVVQYRVREADLGAMPRLFLAVEGA
jgi:hypothetical protein